MGIGNHLILSFYLFVLSELVTCVRVRNDRCVFLDYEGKKLNFSEIGCPQNNVCKKTFDMSIIETPPFSLTEPLIKSIMSCCGTCVTFREIHKFQNISGITPEAMRDSDLTYPFLASSTKNEVHGYHFIPFFDLTDALYVTERRSLRLFQSILELYPLVIICLLLAVIAGYVIWILETWINEEEFPRDFLMGWFEGSWWSFVTMTTVGYGDRTPKSIAGRLFSIVWIFIGLVTCGILTASLTTEIMDANSPPPPDIKNAKVGALRYRDFEQLIIASKGGILKISKGVDFYSDMVLLIERMEKKEIDGILLDKYTLHFATYMLGHMYLSPEIFANYSTYPMETERLLSTIEYFMNKTVRTDLQSTTEKLSYGIILRNSHDYEYLRHVISDNRMRHKIDYDLTWNKLKKEFAEGRKGSFYSAVNVLFSPTEYYFQISIKVIAFVLIAISAFGVFYELKRSKLRSLSEIQSKNNDNKDEDEDANESFLNRVKALNPVY